MRRTLGMLALVAAVGLLAGGCGGSKSSPPLTKAEYVKQMTTIGKGLSTSIGTLNDATSAKDAAGKLTKVQEDLRTAADQLKAITPPDNAKAAHEELTTAVTDFADGLDPIIKKLQNGGSLQTLNTVASLKGFQEIQTAAAAISKAGYNISG